MVSPLTKQTSDRQTEVRQASTRPVGDAPGLPKVAHHFFDGPSTNDSMPVTRFTRRWPEAGWRGIEKATEVFGWCLPSNIDRYGEPAQALATPMCR
jgi:hypothetical protein